MNDEMYRLLSDMSKIAYEMGHEKNLTEETRDMWMEFWRSFSPYEHYENN